MDDLGLFASILGHVGDGNFHESIMYDATIPEERAKVEKTVKNMVDLALEMEGTCTVCFLKHCTGGSIANVSIRESTVSDSGRRNPSSKNSVSTRSMSCEASSGLSIHIG